MEKGHEYYKLNPVICINLLDFVLFKDKPASEYHSCHMIRDLDDPETLLTDHLRIHFIELPKIKPDPFVTPSDRLKKWMYYFIEEGILEDNEMKIIFQDDPIFEQAHETFKEFTADKELRERYEAREKWRKDQAWYRGNAERRGLEQGLEQGREETTLEIAASLKDNGVAVDIICKTTGLTPEEVNAL